MRRPHSSRRTAGPGGARIWLLGLGLVLSAGATVGDPPASDPARPERADARSDSLYQLGDSLQESGAYAEAVPPLRAAVAALRPQFPESARPLARALNLLGRTYLQLAKVASADSALRAALEVEESSKLPDQGERSSSLNGLASVRQAEGNLLGAEALFRESLAFLQATPDRDEMMLVATSNNLALVLQQLGDFETAETMLRASLESISKIRGEESPDVARITGNLALLVQERGNYAEAESLYRRALARYRSTLGEEHPDAITCLMNLGLLHEKTGDHAKAIPCLRQALEARRAKFGSDHPAVTSAITNLASAMQATAAYEEADSLYHEVLAITRRRGNRDRSTADAYNNLGALYRAQGRYAEAEPLCREAYERYAELLGPEHPATARAMSNLGRLASATGRHDEATRDMESALAGLRHALGDLHPDVAKVAANLASSRLAAGQIEPAFATALDAEAMGRRTLRIATQGLSESTALRFASSRGTGLDVLMSIASLPGAPSSAVRDAWDAVIRSRAIVLDEMAARQRTLLTEPSSSLTPLVAQLADARQRLANVSVRGPGRQTPVAYQALLDTLRERRDAVEQQLAMKSGEFRRETKRWEIGLDAVDRALPDSSALVAYVRYLSYGPADTTAAKPAYAAFVLRRGERPRLHALGAGFLIDSLVTHWKDEVQASGEGGDGAARLDRTGAQLRAAIWDPLASSLAGVRRALVVPDGLLHFVAFPALPAPSGEFLVEVGPTIHLLSTERDLVPDDAPVTPGEGMLALGDPDYDARTKSRRSSKPGTGSTELTSSAGAARYRGVRSRCPDFASVQFARLPESLREVKTIERVFGHRHEGLTKLTGVEANESALKRLAAGRRVLHLATHAFFLDGTCVTGGVGTRGLGGLAGGEPSPAPPTLGVEESPLLLSGLVFAGANRRASAGTDEDDGVLTAEEIATLDLSSAEWVVLSACDTGAGRVQAGEGVLGLRRAFAIAGARTLIMSLWSVADEPAREWMEALYDARFERGLDTPDAVRDASVRVLARRRETGESTSPFYWAAFVASGSRGGPSPN